MKYKFDFNTQYNQFYITSDHGSILISNSSTDLDTGYNDRLTEAKNLLVVRTESYGHVQGEINLLNNANQNIDSNHYDHIVEGGLKVESGVLQVLDCPNSSVELEFKVKPGVYRVRIYFSNMLGYDSDEDKENDYYKIEIWPDVNMERKVLKRYIHK